MSSYSSGTTKGKPSDDGGVIKAMGVNATTGGNKSTTITTNLKALVEGGVHRHTTTVEEGLADVDPKGTDILLRMLNPSNAMAT